MAEFTTNLKCSFDDFYIITESLRNNHQYSWRISLSFSFLQKHLSLATGVLCYEDLTEYIKVELQGKWHESR